MVGVLVRVENVSRKDKKMSIKWPKTLVRASTKTVKKETKTHEHTKSKTSTERQNVKHRTRQGNYNVTGTKGIQNNTKRVKDIAKSKP